MIKKANPKQFRKKDIVIFTDFQRSSFKIIGNLYKSAFESLGFTVTEIKTPSNNKERSKLEPLCNGKIVFYNTLGSTFVPMPKSYNIALPVHEWSQYPKQWASLLNRFQEIWVTTEHVNRVLLSSGVNRPLHITPPSLDTITTLVKKDWETNGPFKFYSVGEAHFRKGFHLLMHGFMQAFPQPFEATLTIKTSADCSWVAPREDIRFISDFLSYEDMLALYSGFDCYVSSSLGEGLGLPVAEAILSGLPVATNYWGGHTSLLMEGAFFQIAHDIVDQPFCSNPEFYAVGQQCALSHPDVIARTLRKIVESSAKERKYIANLALEHFLSRYGKSATLEKICERLSHES